MSQPDGVGDDVDLIDAKVAALPQRRGAILDEMTIAAARPCWSCGKPLTDLLND